MRYKIKERVFLVKSHYKLGSITLDQNAWRREFKSKTSPTLKKIKSLVSVFEKTGLVESLAPKRCEPIQKREEARNQLENLHLDKPGFSPRQAPCVVLVYQTIVLSIRRNDCNFKTNKYQDCHFFLVNYYQKRADFASWFT